MTQQQIQQEIDAIWNAIMFGHISASTVAKLTARQDALLIAMRNIKAGA